MVFMSHTLVVLGIQISKVKYIFLDTDKLVLDTVVCV